MSRALGLGAALGEGLLEARDDGGARRRRELAARPPARAISSVAQRLAVDERVGDGEHASSMMARKSGGGT